VSDISSPVGASVHLSPARALIMLFILLCVIVAAFSWAPSWVAAKENAQRCNTVLWHFFMYKVRPELYAKKCGCPNNLDFSFSCNSQYLRLR
jgi:hypothetical protein